MSSEEDKIHTKLKTVLSDSERLQKIKLKTVQIEVLRIFVTLTGKKYDKQIYLPW